MSEASPDRTPVIITAGQSIERDDTVSPLDLMERASRAALTDAPGLESRIDAVTVVNVLSQPGGAPASRLARRLRLTPDRAENTTVGGNTPVWVLGRAGEAVAACEAEAVLVAGAEAMRSRRLARKGEARAPRPPATEDGSLPDDPVVGDDRNGLSGADMAAGLVTPAQVYPLFESVLAHRAGRDPAAQRAFLGELMAPFTEVAAKHPFAWFDEPATPADLAEPGPGNRLTAEPYTKRMNAFMGVDQGAAYVVCSLALARELGLAGQAVPIWSVASVNDVWFFAERPDMGASPGISAAAGAALEVAGITVDDVALLDLYSCFPCAVQMGAAALGIEVHDRRGLTITGGLPYFGGPGNNYPSHSIATAVDRLRERGGTALVTGLGWYATKHSVAVLGAEPPPNGFTVPSTSMVQEDIDATAIPLAVGSDLGGERHRARVEASTVVYGRDGTPESAFAVATLADGRRVVARAHPDEPAVMAGRDVVGEPAEVDGDPPTLRLR